MIIMGIDPGTLVTGYGILNVEASRHTALDFGCIKPPPKTDLSRRYLAIYNGIVHLLDQYKPQAVAIETQYVHKNVQSAIKLGMARGIAVLAATQRDIAVFEYAPSRAKQAVVGNGRASKKQVQSMIQLLLGLKELPEPEDAADALALAVCHANSVHGARALGTKL